MKRLLPIAASLVLAPLLAAFLLSATRDRAPFVPADATPPQWLSADAAGLAPRCYSGLDGRLWWRFDLGADTGEFSARIPGDAFPNGLEIAWFVRNGHPLRVAAPPCSSPSPSAPAKSRVRPGRIFVERIAPSASSNGALLELDGAGARESLFLSIKANAKTSFISSLLMGDGSRVAFTAVSLLFALLFAALIARYASSGSFAAGTAALAVSFALAAFWFDSPSASRGLAIDKGDDSFYLAYAQNLVNHGTFFREPTEIAFGARSVTHCHGLPGVALMLSPPLAARLLPSGAERRGLPLTDSEVRAMRATSALWAFLASVLLFATLRTSRGAVSRSAWDILLPTVLLWGTTMTRWAFVRSIFTHPAEIFLVCLALYIASMRPRHGEPVRNMALAAVAGLLALVRGECLVAMPFILALPLPSGDGPTGESRRFSSRAFLSKYGPALSVLAIFALIYWNWVSHIGTGYGRPADAGLPFSSGPAAVLRAILGNARILLESYTRYGGILPLAAILALAAPFSRGIRDCAGSMPIRPAALALLALLFFTLNCCFSPPLGDEVGHRYSLKLYPLALVWLGAVISASSGRRHALLRIAVAIALAGATATNLHLLMRVWRNDFGQNFSLLTNIQFRALPPSGAGAVNLRFALLLMLAAWTAWLVSELAGSIRRHGRKVDRDCERTDR